MTAPRTAGVRAALAAVGLAALASATEAASTDSVCAENRGGDVTHVTLHR
jgi:hypothetical protein